MRPVVSGKTPTCASTATATRFRTRTCRRPLTLLASATTVRVVDGADEMARHARSYDTGQTIEDAAHVAGLVAATRQAKSLEAVTASGSRCRRSPRCSSGSPRGASRSGSTSIRLLALLDDYGPAELAAAVARGLERGALGAGTIAHILETRRRQRGRRPPLPMALARPARRPRSRRHAPSPGDLRCAQPTRSDDA